MEYSTYKMRTQLLKQEAFDGWIMREGMILVEAVDWDTGEIDFQSRKHRDNWLASTARRFNLGPVFSEESGEVLIDAATRLRCAIESLEYFGFAKMTQTSIILTVPSGEYVAAQVEAVTL